MCIKDPPTFGPGPLTLENAEEWLSWLEDVATIVRDSSYAARVIQLALFAELVKKGIIDGERFIVDLTTLLPRMEHEGYRLALRHGIDDLAEQLALLKHDGSGRERPH
ncbi:hypothetical protein NP603_13840 [Methylomonas sp. SURF-1]|uniref:Uncharacterized protein n=1 Tax=Methylomonas aurea TaxID=2952224 RepID=A0ABT1UIY2_9GAMM|nr:hypothetical protein [Methylomonas sp. SURF-1]MCQ8182199.1 hypothetical protein [Methylomonas sp. SURF-1]